MVLEMVQDVPGPLRSETKSMAELHARIEELDGLKGQMEAVGMSITNAVSDGTLILNHNTDPFPKGNLYSQPKF